METTLLPTDSECPLARYGTEAPEPQLTAVDLFSGIGGFNIAAKQQGIKTIFACDTDKAASECYAANLWLTPKGDIREFKHLVPPHDILMAGLPCQPFSIIGNQPRFDDPQGMLVREVVEIAGRLKPDAILLENVKQLAIDQKGRTLRFIKSLFEQHGYVLDHRVLNARDFGLPQQRERVFIVALLPKFAPLEWPSGKIECTPLADILEKHVDQRYFAKPQIQANRKVKHVSLLDKPAIWHQNISDNVTSKPFSPALRANASYNYLLVNGERRLTEREMLRLQGFPDWFQPASSYQQTRKQTGNAVPVPVVGALLRMIRSAIVQNRIGGYLHMKALL